MPLLTIDNVLVETPNQLDAELTELTSPTTAEIPAEIDITGVITNLGNETIREAIGPSYVALPLSNIILP